MAFFKEKMAIAYDSLLNNNIDMWIIAGQESATNTEPALDLLCDSEFIGLTALIFTKDRKARVVCTPIDITGYEMTGVFEKAYAFPVSFVDTLAEVICELKPKNIALDFSKENVSSDGLSVGTYNLLLKAFDKAGFKGDIVSASPIVVDVRGVKTEDELNKIKFACAETKKIFDDVAGFVKAGMNCQDVYRFIQNEVEKKGYKYSWPAASDPGINSGYGCPGGHVGAPDWPIKKGDLLNIDFGIQVNGYSSDIQRMYYILDDGEVDAPADLKKAFEDVRDSIKEAAKVLKPGITGYEVDKVTRDYLVKDRGYEDFNFATGHQLGKVAHDGGPSLAPRKPRYNRPEIIDTPLKENMVFTIEPGVPTRKGRIGIEEDVVLTKNGGVFLLEPQEELILIKGE